MEFKGLNKNATRMLTGFIMGSIAMVCIMLGGIALLGLLAVVIFFASKEYVKILEHKGFYPSLKIMLASEALLAIITYFDRTEYVALALTLCTFAAFLWVLFRGRQPYIANVSTTILGFVYCGYFPLHLQLLRDISSEQYNDGLGFVVMMFTAILLTDVGCYYAGTRFGKHKLAPVISPNKTIEGSVGGAICAVTGALIVGYFIGVEWYLSVIAGLICTVFAQIGDLCESLIKRDAGVKDSGNSLPGHGGFWTEQTLCIYYPVMFYFCKYFIFSNDIMNYLKGLF